jgi:hypothetical protein
MQNKFFVYSIFAFFVKAPFKRGMLGLIFCAVVRKRLFFFSCSFERVYRLGGGGGPKKAPQEVSHRDGWRERGGSVQKFKIFAEPKFALSKDVKGRSIFSSILMHLKLSKRAVGPGHKWANKK